jgi:outer membrane receptor protein involved in Fe transport
MSRLHPLSVQSFTFGVSLLALAGAAPAMAQTATAAPAAPAPAVAADSSVPEEIIVTAQKRAQSINSVGMSITALGGEQLKQAGINSVADLTKVVPSLAVQQTAFGGPAYSLRGVGFYESSLGAAPTVSIYVDEVGIPYPSLSRLVAFDLDRVEVLKGPQGTLYGQNATGGAINFIAAKPTNQLEAGIDLGYGRFNSFTGEAYVSGPLSDTVKARLAVRTEQSGPWQRSYTRNDTLGRKDQLQGRFLLDWEAAERLKISLSASGWRDRSDTQAGQLIFINPQFAPGIDPLLTAYPKAPANDRAADWSPGINLQRNDRYYLLSGRADYELTDTIKLTSITSYQRYKSVSGSDTDAVSLPDSDIVLTGDVKSFSQELRLSGDTDKVNWLVGGNYANTKSFDYIFLNITDSSNTGPAATGFPKFDYAVGYSNQHVRAYGLFGNVEYKVIPSVTLQAGVRYNNTKDAFVGGARDVDGKIAPIFNFYASLLGPGNNPPIGMGGDYVLDPNNQFRSGPISGHLNEDNVSFRLGANWKSDGGALVYANVSKGYKAGSFPTLTAATADQFAPVVQEEVMAYEAGVKLPLMDRKLQLNIAAFLYDYKNKQLRGKKKDAIFGVIERLLNIPKSQIKGAEAQLLWYPTSGLTLNVSGNYIDAKVKKFSGIRYDCVGAACDLPETNFAGTRLPFTPKWSGNADAQYDWGLNSALSAFVGGSATYNSATNAAIGEPPIYAIKAYALFDVRAGIHAADDRWRITLWGKNITNKYYWTNATRVNDTSFRYAGMPATYGATLALRFK